MHLQLFEVTEAPAFYRPYKMLLDNCGLIPTTRLKSVLSAVTARTYTVYTINVGLVLLDKHIIAYQWRGASVVQLSAI